MERGRYSAKLSLCTSNNALPFNGGIPYSLTMPGNSGSQLRADYTRQLFTASHQTAAL